MCLGDVHYWDERGGGGNVVWTCILKKLDIQ